MYIIPVVNPDGLAYIEANGQPPPCGGCDCDDELTLKTKNTRRVSDLCEDGLQGVNLYRNYDYSWAEANGEDVDQQVCSKTYRGEAPFSESETQAVRDFVLSHQDTLKFVVNY